MVPKISRGGLKRTVDYASNVITYLEVRWVLTLPTASQTHA